MIDRSTPCSKTSFFKSYGDNIDCVHSNSNVPELVPEADKALESIIVTFCSNCSIYVFIIVTFKWQYLLFIIVTFKWQYQLVVSSFSFFKTPLKPPVFCIYDKSRDPSSSND